MTSSLEAGKSAARSLRAITICSATFKKSWYNGTLFDSRLISYLTTISHFTFLHPYSYFNFSDEGGTGPSPGPAGICVSNNSEYRGSICYMPKVFDWVFPDISSHLSNSVVMKIGTLISPFYRWWSWLGDTSCSRARNRKQRSWVIKLGLTSIKARDFQPLVLLLPQLCCLYLPLKGFKKKCVDRNGHIPELLIMIFFFKEREEKFTE